MKTMKAMIIILAVILSGCATEPYNPQRQAVSLMLMNIGAQMMRDSGPRPIYAPSLNAPYRATCVEYGYGITSCRQW